MEEPSKLVFIYTFEWGKGIEQFSPHILEDTHADYLASPILRPQTLRGLLKFTRVRNSLSRLPLLLSRFSLVSCIRIYIYIFLHKYSHIELVNSPELIACGMLVVFSAVLLDNQGSSAIRQYLLPAHEGPPHHRTYFYLETIPTVISPLLL